MSYIPPLEKIQVMTISTCNSNCVFCPYAESWQRANPGRMELKLYQKILVDLEPFKTLTTFCPYLENDPLTDPRIFDWIKMYHDKYPDKTIELSINPGNFTDKNIDNIIKTLKGTKHIVDISFQGMNQTSFEYIMNLPFEPCLKGTLKFLKKAQDDLNIVLRGAGTSRDGKIYYFSNGHFVGFWRDHFNSSKINPDRIRLEPFTFHDRAGQIERTERDANKNNYGIVREIDKDHPFNCIRFDRVFHVLWNGDIAICCMDYKRAVPNLGNLNDMTILEYYNSEPYKKLIAMGTGKIESPKDFLCAKCISPGG